jgi:uncharacterized protein (DUF2141 family)
MKWLLLFALMCSSAFAADLTVTVKNIRSNEGNIKIAVFPPNSGFPYKHENAVERVIVDIVDKEASYTFTNMDEGSYAVAIFHDLDNNDDLNTNRLGIPAEPFGFSNNPRLITGPPTFRKCRVNLKNDKTINIFLKKIF